MAPLSCWAAGAFLQCVRPGCLGIPGFFGKEKKTKGKEETGEREGRPRIKELKKPCAFYGNGHVEKEEAMGFSDILLFRHFGVRSVRLFAGSQPPDWRVAESKQQPCRPSTGKQNIREQCGENVRRMDLQLLFK